GGIIVGGEDTRSIGHFEFDASALPSTINSASLQLFLPNNGFGDDAFNSSQTIEVRSTDFDRTSSPGFYDQVHPPQFVGSDALAQVTITSANAGTTVSFDFNAAGLVYLQNAASGTDTAFNLATYLTAHTYPNRPLLMNPSVPELRYLGSVFENTGGQQAALVVNQIPEPSTLLTLLLGSAALLVRRTRKA
ncbi:MAG: PEP-CTERM sorting domain-containing protein, partial [Akkermansiaceae bacterium]